jgi:hypothetical protein
MTLRLLLIASLSLNALFGAWAWVLLRSGAEGPEHEIAPELAPAIVEEKEPEPEPVPEPPSPPTWADVADHDLTAYAANLGELGLPKNFIQSILLEALLQNLWHRLANADYSDPGLCSLPLHSAWSKDTGREPAINALRTFRSECRRLEIPVDGSDVFNDLDVTQSPLAFLPDAAKQLIDEFDNQVDGIRRSDQSRQQIDLKIEELSRRRESDLKEILSPGDFEEHKLRMSPFARLPRTVRGIELSPDEMRAITRIYTAARQPNSRRQEANEKLSTLLGKKRFDAWRKAVGNPEG